MYSSIFNKNRGDYCYPDIWIWDVERKSSFYFMGLDKEESSLGLASHMYLLFLLFSLQEKVHISAIDAYHYFPLQIDLSKTKTKPSKDRIKKCPIFLFLSYLKTF